MGHEIYDDMFNKDLDILYANHIEIRIYIWHTCSIGDTGHTTDATAHKTFYVNSALEVVKY